MSDRGGPTLVSAAELISSPANARVKALVGLRRRRVRDASGVTLIDGYDEIALAVEAGAAVETIYLSTDLVTERSRLDLAERLADQGATVVRLSRAAFGRASYRESPDGWLAVVQAPERPLDSIQLPDRALVLIAEAVEKPGNLGAMVRTAEAAGVHAVIAAPAGTDWGNPNVVRNSKGTVFAIPVASASVAETIEWARGQGLAIVIATPDSPTPLTETDLRPGVAIVVGAEHAGVGDSWRQAADALVSIPMAGRVNSLNVATSAALLLFEAVRQRADVGG